MKYIITIILLLGTTWAHMGKNERQEARIPMHIRTALEVVCITFDLPQVQKDGTWKTGKTNICYTNTTIYNARGSIIHQENITFYGEHTNTIERKYNNNNFLVYEKKRNGTNSSEKYFTYPDKYKTRIEYTISNNTSNKTSVCHLNGSGKIIEDTRGKECTKYQYDGTNLVSVQKLLRNHQVEKKIYEYRKNGALSCVYLEKSFNRRKIIDKYYYNDRGQCTKISNRYQQYLYSKWQDNGQPGMTVYRGRGPYDYRTLHTYRDDGVLQSEAVYNLDCENHGRPFITRTYHYLK